jgi:hypothetical protein
MAAEAASGFLLINLLSNGYIRTRDHLEAPNTG